MLLFRTDPNWRKNVWVYTERLRFVLRIFTYYIRLDQISLQVSSFTENLTSRQDYFGGITGFTEDKEILCE
jgi:hypothetical protein